MCEFEGCFTASRDGSDYCKIHGGGKRCVHLECDISAIDGDIFCTKHGGGKRCKFEGCKSGANLPFNFCFTHGGGYKCEVEGCNGKIQDGTKVCRKHGSIKDWIKYTILKCQSMDKKKKVKCLLKKDEIEAMYEKQDKSCFYCKILLNVNLGAYSYNQVSIDRVDSKRYHSIDNIVLSCWMCNLAKNNFELADWYMYLKHLANDIKDIKHNVDKYNSCWGSRLSNLCRRNDKRRYGTNNTTITTKEIKERFMSNIYSRYTGLQMFPYTRTHPMKPSCERLDNSKPHTPENTVLVCQAENYARNHFPIEQFEAWVANIKANKYYINSLSSLLFYTLENIKII